MNHIWKCHSVRLIPVLIPASPRNTIGRIYFLMVRSNPHSLFIDIKWWRFIFLRSFFSFKRVILFNRILLITLLITLEFFYKKLLFVLKTFVPLRSLILLELINGRNMILKVIFADSFQIWLVAHLDDLWFLPFESFELRHITFSFKFSILVIHIFIYYF